MASTATTYGFHLRFRFLFMSNWRLSPSELVHFASALLLDYNPSSFPLIYLSPGAAKYRRFCLLCEVNWWGIRYSSCLCLKFSHNHYPHHPPLQYFCFSHLQEEPPHVILNSVEGSEDSSTVWLPYSLTFSFVSNLDMFHGYSSPLSGPPRESEFLLALTS